MRAQHCYSALLTLTLIIASAVSFNIQPISRNIRLPSRKPLLLRAANSDNDNASLLPKPKVIVFDLDGCLWRPEMYKLVWFSGGRGAPFRPAPSVEGQLLTRGNEPVYLLGNVRDVMKDLWTNQKWNDVTVGISSRTDAPDWARELLEKFEVGPLQDDQRGGTIVTLKDVFKGGPIEISQDSKVKHFERIAQTTGTQFEDMLFFDNESGNCREVARLGVTVAYAPDGVTNEIWNVAHENFPQTKGDVIGLDIYGYDSLEGANRFY